MKIGCCMIELFEIVWNQYNPHHIEFFLKIYELPSECTLETFTIWGLMQVSIISGDLVIKLMNLYDISWIQHKDEHFQK